MASPRFQVLVNGEVVTTCGVDSTGGLSVITSWKQSDPDTVQQEFKHLGQDLLNALLEPQIGISVCGIKDSTKEFLVWMRRILEVGDELTIRILPSDSKADPPIERRSTEELTRLDNESETSENP